MRIKSMTSPPVYRDLEEEIETDAAREGVRDRGPGVREGREPARQGAALTNKKRELEEQWESGESGDRPKIGEEEIADNVSM